MTSNRVARRLAVPALLLVLALVAAACNGEEDPAAEPDPAEPDPAEEEPDVDPDDDEPDDAEPEDNPLAGQSLDFVVPFDAGGGYDLYARLMAPHVEEALDATITVRNVSGAGGLVAANQTWAGPTDGSVFQITEGASMVLANLSGEEEVQFDSAQFSWIAGVLGEPTVVTASGDHGIETVEDLIAAGEEEGAIRVTSTGVMNAHSVGGFLMEHVLGTPVEVIAGFDGTDAAFSAVLRGEAHGLLASIGTGIMHRDADEANVIISLSRERPAYADEVPALGDQDVPPEAEEMLDMHSAVADITRSIIGPPDMDPDALQALRDAFEQVLTDEDFLAEAEEQGREIEWRSGEDMESMVQALVEETPQAYLDLIDETRERAS